MAYSENDLIHMMDRLARFFFLAKKYGTALHADTGLTTGARAVLMEIARGETSVPVLAISRGISRQAIQKTVNSLEARGLVIKLTPVDDKRNRLLRVSEAGLAFMQVLQVRERLEVARILDRLPQKDMQHTIRFMDWLEGELDTRIQGLTRDDA